MSYLILHFDTNAPVIEFFFISERLQMEEHAVVLVVGFDLDRTVEDQLRVFIIGLECLPGRPDQLEQVASDVELEPLVPLADLHPQDGVRSHAVFLPDHAEHLAEVCVDGHGPFDVEHAGAGGGRLQLFVQLP